MFEDFIKFCSFESSEILDFWRNFEVKFAASLPKKIEEVKIYLFNICLYIDFLVVKISLDDFVCDIQNISSVLQSKFKEEAIKRAILGSLQSNPEKEQLSFWLMNFLKNLCELSLFQADFISQKQDKLSQLRKKVYPLFDLPSSTPALCKIEASEGHKIFPQLKLTWENKNSFPSFIFVLMQLFISIEDLKSIEHLKDTTSHLKLFDIEVDKIKDDMQASFPNIMGIFKGINISNFKSYVKATLAIIGYCIPENKLMCGWSESALKELNDKKKTAFVQANRILPRRFKLGLFNDYHIYKL